MTEEEKGAIVNVPAIGISFEHKLDGYRSLVMQTAIPADCDENGLNALLDKLARASARLKANVRLPTMRKILEIKEEGLKIETSNLLLATTERDMQQDEWRKQIANSGKRNVNGDLRLSPTQKNDHVKVQGKIAQSEQNIRVLNKQIAEYKRQIFDAETKMEIVEEEDIRAEM